VGQTLLAMGKTKEAVAALDKALGIKGDNEKTHLEKGNALHALGQNDAAVQAYNRAIELKPDLFKACTERAWPTRTLRSTMTRWRASAGPLN